MISGVQVIRDGDFGVVFRKDHRKGEPCALPPGWVEERGTDNRRSRRHYVHADGRRAVHYLEGVSSVIRMPGKTSGPRKTFCCICVLPE